MQRVSHDCEKFSRWTYAAVGYSLYTETPVARLTVTDALRQEAPFRL